MYKAVHIKLFSLYHLRDAVFCWDLLRSMTNVLTVVKCVEVFHTSSSHLFTLLDVFTRH